MFFFGWGRRNINKMISEKEALILSYAYFSIFFVFTITFQYKYSLATLAEQGWHHKAISKEEAFKIAGDRQFTPHWWWQFSLAGVIVIFLIIAFISSLSSGS